MKTLRRVGQAVVRKRTVTDTEIEYLSMQFHRSFRPIERHPSVRVREVRKRHESWPDVGARTGSVPPSLDRIVLNRPDSPGVSRSLPSTRIFSSP